MALIDDALEQGARLVCGGGRDESTLQIEPTILAGCTMDMAIMHEEIFGPVLPVIMGHPRRLGHTASPSPTSPCAVRVFQPPCVRGPRDDHHQRRDDWHQRGDLAGGSANPSVWGNPNQWHESNRRISRVPAVFQRSFRGPAKIALEHSATHLPSFWSARLAPCPSRATVALSRKG